MNRQKKTLGIFLGFTFSWSFLCWGISIFLAITNKVVLAENVSLLNAIISGGLSRQLYAITLLNILAGYGPLLGLILIRILFPEIKSYYKDKIQWRMPLKYSLQISGLFLFASILPAIVLARAKNLTVSLTWPLLGMALAFFIYQLMTAATEEFGWRGYLLPFLLREKTPWQASVLIGVVWALWHTPIIFYVFYGQGLSVFSTIVSFLGFIAGSIAMSTIHSYYYLKTNNLLFNVFIHAISNTIPMFVGMLVQHSYEISVVVQLLLWLFVIIISKKNKTLFDQLQEV